MRNDRERLGNSGEVDLIELVKVLFDKKLPIVVFTVLGALVSLAYVLMTTPVYEAKVFVTPPFPK